MALLARDNTRLPSGRSLVQHPPDETAAHALILATFQTRRPLPPRRAHPSMNVFFSSHSYFFFYYRAVCTSTSSFCPLHLSSPSCQRQKPIRGTRAARDFILFFVCSFSPHWGKKALDWPKRHSLKIDRERWGPHSLGFTLKKAWTMREFHGTLFFLRTPHFRSFKGTKRN